MKNFDEWNELKKNIEDKNRIKIKSGSIWLCNFGINIGYEIDGKDKLFLRPALVVLGFNEGGGLVLPLTTSKKHSNFLIELDSTSKVNLTQIRYLDSRRFFRKIKYINKNKLKSILKELVKLFNTK